MTTWSIDDARQLIKALYSEAYYQTAAPSLNALAERQIHARFHYQEVNQLLAHFQQNYLEDEILLSVIHGGDEDKRIAYEALMLKVSAHLISTVIAIHSFADLIAYNIYLVLNLESSFKREKDVDAYSLKQALKAQKQYPDIDDALDRLTTNASFQHIKALANQAKHRGLLKPVLSEDWTGKRERPYEFRFIGFECDGQSYPDLEITAVMAPAFSLASETIVIAGNLLNQWMNEKISSSC